MKKKTASPGKSLEPDSSESQDGVKEKTPAQSKDSSREKRAKTLFSMNDESMLDELSLSWGLTTGHDLNDLMEQPAFEKLARFDDGGPVQSEEDEGENDDKADDDETHLEAPGKGALDVCPVECDDDRVDFVDSLAALAAQDDESRFASSGQQKTHYTINDRRQEETGRLESLKMNRASEMDPSPALNSTEAETSSAREMAASMADEILSPLEGDHILYPTATERSGESSVESSESSGKAPDDASIEVDLDFNPPDRDQKSNRLARTSGRHILTREMIEAREKAVIHDLFDDKRSFESTDAIADLERKVVAPSPRPSTQAQQSQLRMQAISVEQSKKYGFTNSKIFKILTDRRLLAGLAAFSLLFLFVVSICYTQLNYAVSQFEKKNFKEALGSVDNAIAISPYLPEAHQLRGRILQEMDKHREAIGSFSIALNQKADLTEALAGRANSHLNLGNYQSAVKDYRSWQESLSDGNRMDSNHLISFGNALARSGNVNEALIQYNAVLKKDPKNTGAISGRAACFFELRKYDEAIREYQRILKFEKNDVKALLESTRSMVGKNDIRSAERTFARAMKIAPQDPTAFIYRGSMYAAIKQFDRSFQDFGQAINLNPRSVEAYRARGQAYEAQGNLKKALLDYDTVIRLSGDKHRVEMLLAEARLYNALKAPGKAEELLRKASSSNPDSKEIKVALASQLIQSGKFDQSIIESNKALALDANYPEALLRRGIAFFKKGESDRAFDDLTAAIRLHPQSSEAFFARGMIYLDRQMLHGAEEDLRLALKFDRENVEAAKSLKSVKQAIVALEKSGIRGSIKPSKALKEKIERSSVDVLLRDGQAAYTKGDHGVAVLYLEEALRRDPSRVEGIRALAYACFASKMYGSALRHFAELDRLGVLDLEDKLVFAKVLRATGEGKRAISLYKEYLTSRPVAASVRVELAEALASVGQNAEAIQLCDASLKLSLPAQTAAKLIELKKYLEGRIPQQGGANPAIMPAPEADAVPDYRDPGA